MHRLPLGLHPAGWARGKENERILDASRRRRLELWCRSLLGALTSQCTCHNQFLESDFSFVTSLSSDNFVSIQPPIHGSVDFFSSEAWLLWPTPMMEISARRHPPRLRRKRLRKKLLSVASSLTTSDPLCHVATTGMFLESAFGPEITRK